MVAGRIPLWMLLLVMPLAMISVGLRMAWKPDLGPWWRAASLLALVLGCALVGPVGLEPFETSWGVELLAERPAWPGVALLLVATLLGAPLFVALAGCAVLLFLAEGISATIVAIEMEALASQPFLPAIPLFTLTGFLLAEGQAPARLLRVFRAVVGWLPGGTAVIAALMCAFLSVFTGGSGVTILALGGLLFHALSADGYRERFSLGLITSSGSLGILLPPALPLILYGIAAEVPIPDLFRAGIGPGLLLIALIAGWGMLTGWRSRVPRTPFHAREAGRAIWAAKLELLLPVVTLGALFSGFATLVEAASLTVVYALVVQVLVQRDISVRRDLMRVLRRCATLLGGVLVILCSAKGLSYYMVDAAIPMRLLEWIQSGIQSPLVFLLCLNGFLLLVGCFLDIYSATFVVVPLLLPLGAAFGIDPLHLGIIFVANLELGYLTPPVGLNLFLASYRFERPLLTVYRAALPPFALLALGVLVITYVPGLTRLFF